MAKRSSCTTTSGFPTARRWPSPSSRFIQTHQRAKKHAKLSHVLLALGPMTIRKGSMSISNGIANREKSADRSWLNELSVRHRYLFGLSEKQSAGSIESHVAFWR